MNGTLYVGATRPEPDRAKTSTWGLFRRQPGDTDWQQLGKGLPEDLHVNCIVRRPNDPRSIYVGAQAGVFHSADGGERWTDLGLETADRSVFSIWLHPTEPDTLLAGLDHCEIAKTTDHGATWRRLPTVQPAAALDACFPVRVLRMVAKPDDPGELYASLEVGGIIRSIDGGESWQDVSAPLVELSRQPHLKSQILSTSDTEGMLDVHALATSAARADTVWAALRMGLFLSEDRGETWRELGIGRFSDLTYGRDIIVSSHDPRILYAALSESARGGAGSLYVSHDVGETWQRVDRDISIESTVMGVAVSAEDASRIGIAVRNGQVFASDDGGASWDAMPLPGNVDDVRAIVYA